MSSAAAVSGARGAARSRSVWRPWLAGWLGATTIGVANGIARRALYEERLGTTGAHYFSTATLLVLLGGYTWLLTRRWPIPRPHDALLIGGVWTALTVTFEFGLGRYVAGDSWAKLLEQYDLARGNVWILVPIWMTIGPAVLRRLRSSRIGAHQEAAA